MKSRLQEFEIEDLQFQESFYIFHSAKKIYFTPASRSILLEKCNRTSKVKSISLCTRKTVVVYKKNNMLLYRKD